MEFLNKIPQNLVIILIAVVFFIILVNLNVITLFGGGEGEKETIIKEYVTNKKLDSLIQVIKSNQEVIDKYNDKIEDYQKSIDKIDIKLSSNKKELDKITDKHEENINNIKDYSSNELYKYLSDRYSN